MTEDKQEGIRRPHGEECPTDEYEIGSPNGKCWGDGHYFCDLCAHFRNDFKADASLRDKLLQGQGVITITEL
jgi:hypothetical protein